MINKHFLALCCVAMISLGHITCVNAKTNFDNLHTKHDVVAKYECGDMGYQAISKDGYGGYSYGKWQISTQRKNGKPSTFDFFLTYLKENSNNNYYKDLNDAGGYKAAYMGTKRFTSVWRRIAGEKNFQRIYDKFLLDTQIIPVYIRMDKNGSNNFDILTTWASEDNAIQAAVKSTIIQHGQGGAYKIFQNILTRMSSKKEFLKKLYAYRIYKYPQYKKRYNAEYKDLETYLISGKSKIHKDIKVVMKVKKPGKKVLEKLVNVVL